MVSSMGAGGAERVAANLCNAWAARGDTVTLVATYPKAGGSVYALQASVRFINLADSVAVSRLRWWTQVQRLWALRQLTKDVKADVVISFLTNVNVASILATMGLRVPTLVAEHSYPPKMPLPQSLAWLRRLTYPLATRVVMLTQLGLTWLNQAIPDATGEVVSNPVVYPLPSGQPTRAVETVIPLGSRLAIGVGRLAPEKQFDHLIQAFANLAPQFPEWVLAIAGDGPLRNDLERLCHQLGVAERVYFPGRVGNLGDWYKHAELFVLSSIFEGFPGALVEAMANGCAVVSYNCDSGPGEIIRDGEDGLLVDPAAGIPALEDAMRTLMASDAERKRLGDGATNVRVRYSLPNTLAQWDRLFDAVTRKAP